VDLLVQVDSLEVLTPPDTAEIRKVTAAMREDVLRAEQYPEIRFVSTSVAPREGGYRVQGGLTIVGVTREVSIDLTGVVGPDSLRMEGRFSVNQTDFGIRPFRGGPAGVIKVADRVEFHIIAIGTP
jgi:polyisoprenoid-binding protein YceI